MTTNSIFITNNFNGIPIEKIIADALIYLHDCPEDLEDTNEFAQTGQISDNFVYLLEEAVDPVESGLLDRASRASALESINVDLLRAHIRGKLENYDPKDYRVYPEKAMAGLLRSLVEPIAAPDFATINTQDMRDSCFTYGYSLADIARACGVSRQAVDNWGETKRVPDKRVSAIVALMWRSAWARRAIALNLMCCHDAGLAPLGVEEYAELYGVPAGVVRAARGSIANYQWGRA